MTVYKSKKTTKDGRQYFFRIKYKDIFGISHDYTSQKYKTLAEAKEEEIEYRIKLKENQVSTSNITIKQAYLEYRKYKSKSIKKQTTKKDDDLFKYLKSIENIKINDIDVPKYKKFELLLEKNIENNKISVRYANYILGLLKQIIRYSNKYYNTSNSILEFIENFKEVNKIKKEMQFFTYEEYLKFDNVIGNFEFHTFFEILYFLGLRQGELQALTWNDVNLENNTIKIKKTLTTKIKGEKWTISSPKTKGSIRTLPLTNKVTNDLNTMKNSAKKYKDYSNNWFVFGNTEPFKESTIQSKKNLYCKLANVKQIRIHDFRHSCASLLINQGANITLVSKYLGHSKISITLDTYTHLYKNELDNMTDILNKL